MYLRLQAQFNIKTSIKSNHYLYRLNKKNIITSIDTEKILMFLHSVIKSPSKVGIEIHLISPVKDT